MDAKSLNITSEKLEQLRSLFPEVFSEGKVDFSRLKDILGENVAFPNEHYELSWAGKAEARREIQKQTSATLIPDKEGSINFGETENIFIEGENLEVLRILQKSYFGKVKMIYIDPPYNTGNDSFVYPDDYAERLDEYNKRTGTTDEQGFLNKQDLWRKNSRDNGQFHSVWLSMMYPRLYLARNLLSEDGMILVSIDDNEIYNLRMIMNEIFGEESFLACFIWHRRQMADSRNADRASTDHEYVVAYRNSKAVLRGKDIDVGKYTNPDNDPRGPWFSADITGLATKDRRPNLHYDVVNPKTGIVYHPSPTRGWSVAKETFEKLIHEDRILWPSSPDGRPRRKKFLNEVTDFVTGLSTMLDVGFTTEGTRAVQELFGNKIIQFPKPLSLITTLVQQVTSLDDIVLDFFAGSGTTAQAVLELNEEDGGNRKFVCVQLPEPLEETNEAYKAGYHSIADICKARIQKVIAKLQTARAKELPLQAKQLLGFSSFKLAPSSFKAWRGDVDGDELLKQLEVFRQTEKDLSDEENMLYELLLKSGLPLTSKIEMIKVGEQNIYLVEDGKLLVFFETYNKTLKDFIHERNPRQVVCLDSVFNGKDEDLSNFKLELKDAEIELTVI